MSAAAGPGAANTLRRFGETPLPSRTPHSPASGADFRPGAPGGGPGQPGVQTDAPHRPALVDVTLRRPARPGAAPVRGLALHGLAGSAAVWRPYEELALPEMEWWEAGLPWEAAGDPTWSHRPDPARWVDAALDAMPGGVDVLFAHSFAAPLALQALARRPAATRPRAVVVVAPFHRRRPEQFSWETATHYLNGFHRILEEGLRIGSQGRLGKDLRRDMALRVRDRVGPYGWLRFFEAYLNSPFLDVAALGLPVLVVAGADDFSAPPDDARALAAALPDARLRIFEDCGHFAMAERPQDFADAVHTFVHACFPAIPSPTIPSTQRS
ncbi:alpha/beta hydrolase [Streptomyces sp. E11-3]|uniref:alpha/beta fold hydrolase n=1 Tax=Streptomyces sp. E11-3 TaxID=3110112 RepID=UPI00397F41BF